MTNVLKVSVLSCAAAGIMSAASACTAGDTLFASVAVQAGGGPYLTTAGTGNSQGGTVTPYSCSENGFTFSNFALFGVANATGSTTIITGNGLFSMTLGAATSASAGVLDFGFTGVVNPADFRMIFSVSSVPSAITLSGASTVIETFCDSQGFVGNTASCKGSTYGSITIPNAGKTSGTQIFPNGAAGLLWVNKDISQGSEFTQTLAPEPMTLSLTGLGLLGLGFFGRRVRK